jgi:hypothetical protein
MKDERKSRPNRLCGKSNPGSGESGAECGGADEVDSPDAVVGQHAQRYFADDGVDYPDRRFRQHVVFNRCR